MPSYGAVPPQASNNPFGALAARFRAELEPLKRLASCPRGKQPLPYQREFLGSNKRYVIACSGTKAGKSVSAAMYAVREAIRKPGGIGLWIAPSYAQSVSIGMEEIKALVPHDLFQARMSPPPPRIRLANDTVIEFKSADEPDNIFGAKYNFAVVDEAGRITEEAWHAITSTLTQTRGPIRLFSNPCPRTSWFFRLYLRGLDGADPDVASFRWKTADNPFVPREELEDKKRNLPDHVWRSLYEGEFLETPGSVFGRARECATGHLEEPAPNRKYVGGFDPARVSDFAVCVIMDREARKVVAIGRWQKLGYEAMAQRVGEMSKKYNGAQITVDSTHGSIGDALLEIMERAKIPVQGFQFTNQSKRQIIEKLAVLVDKKRIILPAPTGQEAGKIELMLSELEAYEGKENERGTVSYSAPNGCHDDIVTALALACHRMPVDEGSVLGEGAVTTFGDMFTERSNDKWARGGVLVSDGSGDLGDADDMQWTPAWTSLAGESLI